jgi:hypothetical protein
MCPMRFTFKHPDPDDIDEDIIFTCKLNAERCSATNKNGTQCKRMTIIGFEYCCTHLKSVKHLKIANSELEDGGKGLFAFDTVKNNNAIVFKKNQIISEYKGEIISKEVTNERYGKEYTGPYAIEKSKKNNIDAGCKRCVASLANTNTNRYLNAYFVPAGGRVYLKASKAIKNGQEIYVDYGDEYSFDEDVSFSTKYIKK